MGKKDATWNEPNWRQVACAALMLCLATATIAAGQSFSTLYNFCPQSFCPDGYYPYAGLLQGTDGNFYGAAANGGASLYGGTAFKITPSGAVTTLYSFCAKASCADGYRPFASLLQATDSNFYGTTIFGGANGGRCSGGCGTVFKMTSSGTLTTIHSFVGTDGSWPGDNLVQAIDGNLYGTTSTGGSGNYGTVFKISSGGTLTTLHSFDKTDGAYPTTAGVVQATDGNFYGTTLYGGANSDGTVFKMTPSGTLTTLHSFCSQSGCADGYWPYAGLLQATDGNFYGTAHLGGVYGGGTVFKITPDGTLTVLYSFCSQSGCTDGKEPFAGLIQATDGNFYGTTQLGGAQGDGTVFEITPSGTLTTLYSFCSQSACADGQQPFAPLVQATNGNFYGATVFGGTHCQPIYECAGTIFVLSTGLGPFVEALPASGTVKEPVGILGNNLTGTSSVTFNGTAATFTVVSPSLIRTTVPAGATTGSIQVVTPSGTLTSNVAFRVR
jgi:uncharacterized repeat protein (TIGR03803 family)